MEALIDILGNIGFDWKTALANLFNFLIIFFLLNKFVFSKIKDILAERKEKIEQGIMDAEKAKTALLVADQEKEILIKNAKVEASSIVNDAFQKSQAMMHASHADAEREYQKVLKHAEKEIEKRTQKAEKALRQKTVDMVLTGVSKVLQDEMTPSMQNKIVKNLT